MSLMSKKRLRTTRRYSFDASRCPISKWEPEYWRNRLFKSTYNYLGRRFRTRNWSVKIQHLGQRKTFSLLSGAPAQAAVEACMVYRRIVSEGWETAITS